jgi:hypothetical protein
MLSHHHQFSSDEMEAIATAAYILQAASTIQGDLQGTFQDALYSYRPQRKKRAVEPSELGLRTVYEPSDKASAVVEWVVGLFLEKIY